MGLLEEDSADAYPQTEVKGHAETTFRPSFRRLKGVGLGYVETFLEGKNTFSLIPAPCFQNGPGDLAFPPGWSGWPRADSGCSCRTHIDMGSFCGCPCNKSPTIGGLN